MCSNYLMMLKGKPEYGEGGAGGRGQGGDGQAEVQGGEGEEAGGGELGQEPGQLLPGGAGLVQVEGVGLKPHLHPHSELFHLGKK